VKLKKLKEMLEYELETLTSIPIVFTDKIQFTLSRDNKTLYLDNITEEQILIKDLLDILNLNVGRFMISTQSNLLDPEEVAILEFEEEFSPESVIEAIKEFETKNNNPKENVDG